MREPPGEPGWLRRAAFSWRLRRTAAFSLGREATDVTGDCHTEHGDEQECRGDPLSFQSILFAGRSLNACRNDRAQRPESEGVFHRAAWASVQNAPQADSCQYRHG